MWIQFNDVEHSLPATANGDVDLNGASSALVQVKALSPRWTPSCVFLCQGGVFFFHFGTFLQEKSQTNTFDWNHRLNSSGQELRSTEEFTGKIQGYSHYLWEPAYSLFWLEQELHVEGEQVKYFKIQFSFVVFRSNARSHSRHPFHDHTDGRRVAKMSCDSKYIVKKGLNS